MPAPTPAILDQFGRPYAGAYRPRSVYPRLGDPAGYGDFDARLLRYNINWAFYSACQYNQDFNAWSERFRHDEGLYKHTRAVLSVGFRLGEFWGTHLLGGPLDHDAGDGVTRPSALPIVADDPRLREAVAKLWRDSRWSVKKDSLARHGSIKGDVAIEVVPRFAKARPAMRVVPPETIAELEKDADGNVTGATFLEMRPDPEATHRPAPAVEYRRTITRRDSGQVDVYTYRDRDPYSWGEGPTGRESAWTLEVDFCPVVHVEHLDIGFGWGASELSGVRSKIAESDALGSNLADWTYRALNGPRFLTGAQQGDVRIQVDDRESFGVYFGPKDARMQSMLDPLPVGEVTGWVAFLLGEILADHPELSIDKQRASGDMSGKSLREGRKPAETRVKSRRAAYDLAMVRAHQMGISIGVAHGWAGYEGFDAGSFDRGDLDHQIGERDVFLLDPFDRIEEQTGRFAMAQAARAAGMTLADALSRAGAAPEEVANAQAEQQRQEFMAMIAGGLPPQAALAVEAMAPALAGAMAQFVTPPGPTQVETRATQDRQALA